jgi:hypothetical protein
MPLFLPTNLFGSFYQYSSADADATTSSNTYQSRLLTNVTIITGGFYFIGWHALIRTATANRDFRAQVLIDGVTTISEISYRNAVINHHYNFSGFFQENLTAGVHTFDIRYSSLSASSTTISRTRFAIWRVQ